MIQCILLDVDGTLTNAKKEITPKTRDALIKVQEHGVTLVLSSGRTDNGLARFAKELEMDTHGGLLVCFNGAKVVNFETKEVYFNQAMSAEDAKAVLEHLKQFDVVPMIDKGEYMYVTDVFNHDIEFNGIFNIMKYESRSNGYLLCEKRDLAEFVDYPLNKILTFATPSYLQSVFDEMKEPFKDTLNCMFTAPYYVEYTAQGVDKAKAISTAIPFKPEEMMAFGDAQNDSTMLRYVGVGVAMGNAVDEVKKIADEVTLSNEEDGIAHTLYKYFPEYFK